MRERFSWKTALIALGALVLFVGGLSVVVINIARGRVQPQTTTPVVFVTATPLPTKTTRPTAVPTNTLAPAESGLDTVVGVVRDYEPGALIIVIVPTEGEADQIIVPDNIEVTWLSGMRSSAREIVAGQTLYAEGTLDSLGRLVAQSIVIVEDAPAAAYTATPAPTATSTPLVDGDIPWQAWRGEYFANTDLTGTPLLVRQDAVLSFEWGQGSPNANIPKDGFSARWRGRWPFEEGLYTFSTRSDDGIRVYIDDVLVVEEWYDHTAVPATADIYVYEGEHVVTVEYYEAADEAAVSLGWEHQGDFPAWKGEYFDNTDLYGQPILIRSDNEISFYWGLGAPASSVPTNDFSVRWTRSILVAEAAYHFYARADDGVRVWVDDRLIIDEWHEADASETYEGYAWLDTQPHKLRVEYYDGGGNANVNVWWEEVTRFSGWRGEYFNNRNLDDPPFFVRSDDAVDFDWGNDSIGYGLPADDFSARWVRTTRLQEGTYYFTVVADDGVRLYIDDELIIDEWHDAEISTYDATVNLDEGKYTLTVEYYEHVGEAVIQVDWSLVGTTTPTPTVTKTATATPTFTKTATPTATKTATSTPTPTLTPTGVPPTSTPIQTATPTSTNTQVPSTPAATEAPPTATTEPSDS